MTVAVTGASGFIGGQLVPALARRGHRVIRLVRRASRGPDEREWSPAGKGVDPALFGDVDAVVHLAAESVAGGRWTAARRAAIRESRVAATSHLVEALARSPVVPRVFLAASAVGYYGERGEAALTETDRPGTGFLSELAVAWEATHQPLRARGVRTVAARLGIVLGPDGGALAKMLPPFRLGLGARLGSGRQWMSWIAADDCVAALITCLEGDLEGPVNLTAPSPVTNAEFTATLGQVLNRPAFLIAPGAILELALGDFAKEGLLASTRVLPRALETSGFAFRYPTLEPALRAILGRDR